MVEVLNVIPPSPYKRPRFVAAVTPAERLKVREMHRRRGESKIQGPKRKVKEGEIVSFKFNKAQVKLSNCLEYYFVHSVSLHSNRYFRLISIPQ